MGGGGSGPCGHVNMGEGGQKPDFFAS